MTTNNESPFSKLCETGDCEVIRNFLKAHKVVLLRTDNKLFVKAVESDNIELLKILLELDGANPSYKGNHPLRVAIASSKMEFINIIMDHPKTDLMHKCYKVLKAASNSEKIVIIRKILERVPPRYLFGMWYHYINTGNTVMLSKFKLMMEQWFFLNACSTKTAVHSMESFGYTSLTYAASVKCAVSMKYLVENFIHHTDSMYSDMIRQYVQLRYHYLLRIIFDTMEQNVFESVWKKAIIGGDIIVVDFILRHYGNHPSVDIYKAFYLASIKKSTVIEKRLCRELDFQMEVYKRYILNAIETSNSGE